MFARWHIDMRVREENALGVFERQSLVVHADSESAAIERAIREARSQGYETQIIERAEKIWTCK